ncbi:MAG: TIM barrel protein [Candidatus ainarchaeum sp.]|nr:TIM barrel protein [Candidatus ainarchaeum sp.]
MDMGLSTNIITTKNEWDLFLQILSTGKKNVEIHNSITPIRTKDINTLKDMVQKGYVFSLHSATNELLENNNPISRADYAKIESEIFIANQIGIKYIIFHLPGGIKYSEGLEKLSNLAKKNNVQLLVENDPKETFFDIPNLIQLLEKLDLKMCLDLGHLNIETKGNIKKQKDIILLLGNKIYQVHLHSNNAKKDQHKALSKKQLLLLKLLPENTRLIAESLSFNNILKTIKLVENYFSE